MPLPSPGSPAPDFTAAVVGGSYDSETEVTLSDLRGRPVVLYFYPKDDTPGCTAQACGLRDAWSGISRRAHLFGISPDSIRKHQNFIREHDLPFPLISDEDMSICERYGVWVEKSMDGRKYMGVARTTFVIDAEGAILTVIENVKPKEHAAQIETLLESAGG